MKKTFKLNIEGKHPERLLEAIKHEVRKYIKRERNKPLPIGAHYWAFDCRFGASEAEAEVVHVGEIIRSMDRVVAAGGNECYVEIIARAAAREPKPVDGDEGDFD